MSSDSPHAPKKVDRKTDANAVPSGPQFLETPEHGRGKLRRGGPSPGSGRRPAIIRKRALVMLANNLDVLGHIASGTTVAWEVDGKQVLVTPKPGERVAAVKVLADLGMGDRVAVSDVRTRIRTMLAVLQEQETWTRDELLSRLGVVWA